MKWRGAVTAFKGLHVYTRAAMGLKNSSEVEVDWDKNLALLCGAVDQYALQWAR